MKKFLALLCTTVILTGCTQDELIATLTDTNNTRYTYTSSVNYGTELTKEEFIEKTQGILQYKPKEKIFITDTSADAEKEYCKAELQEIYIVRDIINKKFIFYTRYIYRTTKDWYNQVSNNCKFWITIDDYDTSLRMPCRTISGKPGTVHYQSFDLSYEDIDLESKYDIEFIDY